MFTKLCVDNLAQNSLSEKQSTTQTIKRPLAINKETHTASKDSHNNTNTNITNQDSLEFLEYFPHRKRVKILSIINHQLNP